MVIETRIHNGLCIDTRICRNVVKNLNYSKFLREFLAHRHYCKWGVMTQLKGKQRIELAHFGTVES